MSPFPRHCLRVPLIYVSRPKDWGLERDSVARRSSSVAIAAFRFNIWYFRTTKNSGDEENQEIYRADFSSACLCHGNGGLFSRLAHGN